MKYNDTLLILDNFRSVLSSFDVDTQDVVRSAILDGVDIMPYFSMCNGDPYRLDQIRLAIKEGMSLDVFSSLSGEQLFVIRRLKNGGYNINQIITQIKAGRVSECYFDYLISWVAKGVDISNLKLSLIPKKMLEIFDKYLCQGQNMLPFNNGKVYSANYVMYCIAIQSSGKDISVFTNEEWDLDALSVLSGYAKNTSLGVWNSAMSELSRESNASRVSAVFEIVKHCKGKLSSLGIKELSEYDNESLLLLVLASKSGMNYRKLVDPKLSFSQRKAIYDEMVMNKGKKISGVVTHG